MPWPAAALGQARPDPRDRTGRHHRLVGVLAAAAAAVVAGARSVTAIAGWAADTPSRSGALGARRAPLPGRRHPPREATIRRVPARIDADAVDLTVGAWLAGRLRPPTRRPRRVPAADGATLRGATSEMAPRSRCWPRWTTPTG